MGWFDDLADKVGFSSRALGVNTAEDKAARAAAEQQAAQQAARDASNAKAAREDAEYYKSIGRSPGSTQSIGDLRQIDDQQRKNASDAAFYQDRVKQMQNAYDLGELRNAQGDYEQQQRQSQRVANAKWDQGAYDRGEAMGGWTPAEGMIQKPDDRSFIQKGIDTVGGWVNENPNAWAMGTQIATGLGGYLASKEYQEKAQKTLEDAAAMAGTYRDLGISQASQIAENPELTGMQMGVLKKLQGVAEAGQTAEDEAYRRQQQNAVNKQFQARQAQIGEEMARRGAQAGSGMGLAASIGGNATALQQASEAADADMIRKQQARMGALKDISSQASNMQQNQFYRDYNKASAADRFNEANVTNLMKAKQNQAEKMGAVAGAQSAQGSNLANLIGKTGNAVVSAIPNANVNKQSATDSIGGAIGGALADWTKKKFGV